MRSMRMHVQVWFTLSSAPIAYSDKCAKVHITSCKLPSTSYPEPITNYPLPVTCFQLPPTHYTLPVTGSQLPVTPNQLQGNSMITQGWISNTDLSWICQNLWIYHGFIGNHGERQTIIDKINRSLKCQFGAVLFLI